MKKSLMDSVCLKLVDAKLMINGSVTTNDITRHTGLGRQKVSQVFSAYMEANPDAMFYVPSKKKYIAHESFKPCFLDGAKPGEYIDSVMTTFGIFSNKPVEDD